MLGALQLHPRPGDQRHRRAVHRDVFLTRALAAAAAVAAAAIALGCGGGTGSGGADHELIVALGDSITAGNPGYDPDPARRKAFGSGDDPRSQWEYWAQREHPDLEFRNCGVRGQSTFEIGQRLDGCTQGADGVVIQGGTNDIAAGLPAAATAANLRGMVRSAKELNLDVAIADVPPLNVDPGADPVIRRLNDEIRQIAREEAITLLPFHRVLEDPHAPERMPPRWSADGIHPSVEGYRRLGELAFKPPGD